MNKPSKSQARPLADILHNYSHAVAGLIVFAVFGAAAAAQIVLGKTSRRSQVTLGLTAMLAGLTLVTVTHDSSVARRAQQTAIMRDGLLTIRDSAPARHLRA